MAGEVDGLPQGGIGRQGIELYGIGEIVMKNHPEYYIAMAADDNYARHLGVCLISLFENNRDRKFAIYVCFRTIFPLTISERLKKCAGVMGIG